MIHTVKAFGIVNKAEVDVFLELSLFFDNPTDVGNLISGSSAFSKTSLNIWKLTVHVLLQPGLEDSEHYFTSVWHECNLFFFNIILTCKCLKQVFLQFVHRLKMRREEIHARSSS